MRLVILEGAGGAGISGYHGQTSTVSAALFFSPHKLVPCPKAMLVRILSQLMKSSLSP